MPLTREERKLRNSTQPPIAISPHAPSVSQMADGERLYSRVPGKNLRLYLRLGPKLYYTEFLPVEEETSNNWEELS
jgi:hypothetical protein